MDRRVSVRLVMSVGMPAYFSNADTPSLTAAENLLVSSSESDAVPES